MEVQICNLLIAHSPIVIHFSKGFLQVSDSVPACLNSNPISNPRSSLVSHHQSHPPTFFDPCANFLNPFSQSQVENLSQRSEPNCTLDFGSSSSQGLVSQGLYPSSSTSMQSRPSHDNGPGPLTKSDQKSGVKNPKKRTRASRTAPTTVVTTDTINFRAIVQEFTGIPAPPFPGSSYPYSPRLDLFGLGSRSGMRYSHLETLGSLYALRPSAKRMKPIPIASSSPLSLLTFPLVDANITIPTSSNYVQLATEPDLGILKQPHNMLNLHNFQPCLNLPGFTVSSHGSSAMSSLDEFGLSHGNERAVGVKDGNQDQNSERA